MHKTIIAGLCLFVLLSSPAYGWDDSDYAYRRAINTSGSTNPDYPYFIEWIYDVNQQADMDDFRCYDLDGNIMSYWIENKTDSVSMDVWVRGNTTTANTTVGYCYYGNATVSNASDGTLTFDFFDDFNDASLNVTKWNIDSGVENTDFEETGGNLEVYGNAGTKPSISGTRLLYSKLFEFRALFSSTNTNSLQLGIFNTTNTDDFSMYTYGIDGNAKAYTRASGTYTWLTDGAALSGMNTWQTYKFEWVGTPRVRLFYDSTQFGSTTGLDVPLVAMGAWISGGNAGSGTLYVTWARARHYVATEPTISIGVLESQTGNVPPLITINNPANTTYHTISIPVNITVSDSDSPAFWCAIYDDGALLSNETTNTTYTTTLTKTGGAHNVSVHCDDYTGTRDSSINYYVWMGLNVSAFNGGNNTVLSGWSIYATNGSFNYSNASLNNPSIIEWDNLPTGSTNITFSIAGFKNATYERTLNNSAIVQLDGNLYHWQYFYAKDIDTDATLNIWNILLTNGTTNTTQSVTSGVASFGLDELPRGSVNITISKDGYNTNTTTITIDGNSTISYITYLKKAGLYVIVKDETTLAALSFNITIFNSTTTQTWTNETEFSKAWYDIPTGIITIQITEFWGNYTARNYYTTMTSTTAYTLTSYLLPYADSTNVGFVAIDSYDATLSAVLITAQKLYNATWTTVAQGKTDGAGTTNIYMNPLGTYKIKVEKDGYITQYVTITPSATNPTYTIRLPTVRAINFTTLFDDISYRFTPQTPSLDTDTMQYINFTISSSGGNLQYYGLNITYNGSVIFSHEVTTDPYGGEIGALVNLTGKTGTLYVSGYFFKTDYGLTYLNTTYKIWNYEYGNYTIAAIIESWKDETHVSKEVSAITLMVLSACVMIPVASLVSTGVGFVGIIMLSLGLYAEIVTTGQWLITVLVVASIMFLRGRI